jgi:hypothetical protein
MPARRVLGEVGLGAEREPDRAGLALLLRAVGVVEQGQGPVGLHADVVLPFEPGSGARLEVGVLAAERPDHLAGAAADLVHPPGVARGHEQVPVRELLD